jgi:hypothetical protein
MCDGAFPNPTDLGFALSFDANSSIRFLDDNQWTFDAQSIRILTNKGDEILHDFKMNEVAGAMKLFVNQDGSIDGKVQNLHFTGGEIVNEG